MESPWAIYKDSSEYMILQKTVYNIQLVSQTLSEKKKTERNENENLVLLAIYILTQWNHQGMEKE